MCIEWLGKWFGGEKCCFFFEDTLIGVAWKVDLGGKPPSAGRVGQGFADHSAVPAAVNVESISQNTRVNLKSVDLGGCFRTDFATLLW